MTRNLAITALILGLAAAVCPDLANAASPGAFLGARFYAFGGPAPELNRVNLGAEKTLPPLANPLDFLRVYTGVPTSPLTYPFLNPPQPESISRPLCNTASLADPQQRISPGLGCSTTPGYIAAKP